MRAMCLRTIGALDKDADPLTLEDIPVPEAGRGELLIRVLVCGVCHTELDEIEGRTPPPTLPVVPGHEVIGRVEALGDGVDGIEIGQRVGVGWIFRSDGGDQENLSPGFRATGRDVNGGYAEFMTVAADYAYPIPDTFSDEEAAPLLCAGAVGYRALRLTGIEDGQVLGLTGFGGSGHLVLQMAKYRFPGGKVLVFARSARERSFAMELGADWAGDTHDAPPVPADAIIDTTPAWSPMLAALKALKPGGRLVINAIRKEADDKAALTDIDYARHLWMEKEIKSVANVTARDVRECLALAAEIPLRPVVASYPLDAANDVLRQLKFGHIRGAYILKINN